MFAVSLKIGRTDQLAPNMSKSLLKLYPLSLLQFCTLTIFGVQRIFEARVAFFGLVRCILGALLVCTVSWH